MGVWGCVWDCLGLFGWCFRVFLIVLGNGGICVWYVEGMDGVYIFFD